MEESQSATFKYDVDDVCRRFAMIYTGAIADVLDEIGRRDQVLPSEIQALTLDQSVCGIAMTVEGEPTASQDPEEVYIPILEMLGSLKPNDVIVSQPHDNISAHLGELSAETAKFRGARGAVIDGGARDIDYILKLGFPVFCRYRTPSDVIGRWKLISRGQPVKIGKVTVQSGDFVVGDKDGVVIIPQEITLEVLEKSEAVVGTENLVRKSILQGMHPVEAYRKYGRF
ncbi:MAG: RraA family protein [Terriglobia bacterium]